MVDNNFSMNFNQSENNNQNSDINYIDPIVMKKLCEAKEVHNYNSNSTQNSVSSTNPTNKRRKGICITQEEITIEHLNTMSIDSRTDADEE
jgi:hypothetical protein